MSFLLSIIPAIVVLAVLIVVHEFGHFLACRMVGVKVDKFSIGFGPELVHWQGKETRFAISAVPLGGFVKPAGETIGEIDDMIPKPGHYLAAPVWHRIVIVCAGVVMNYLLAFVLFAALYMVGSPVTGTTIGGLIEDYPAIQSGLQEGDRIVQVNESEVKTWAELTGVIHESSDGPLRLHVQRDDRILNISVTPVRDKASDLFGEEIEVKRIGISVHPEAIFYERTDFLDALRKAWKTEVFLTVATHKAIFYLLQGKMSAKTISGPIGIINLTGSAAKLGAPYVLQLMAVLSISLAVINLLPVPALDGGHLFFLLIEALTRQKVSLGFQEKAAQIGFMLLLLLMVFVIYNDLVNVGFFSRIQEMLGAF